MCSVNFKATYAYVFCVSCTQVEITAKWQRYRKVQEVIKAFELILGSFISKFLENLPRYVDMEQSN